MRDWLFEVFPDAYEIASEQSTFTPMVRQLYYVARRLLQERGCERKITDATHRKILEEYEINIGHRLCYRKSVGELIEPHSQCPKCGLPQGCNLGTEAVGSYQVPAYRFNKILYVEKAGFMHQLLAENIHNKYDVAIAASAGFSPQAAKELFAKIEKEIPVEIYCLHDADIAGIEIYRTLGKKLIHENYNIKVIDFGLAPQEAIKLNLPSETVSITSEPSWELKQIVAKKELKWLLGKDMSFFPPTYKGKRKIRYIGNRVELNAFTPKEFIKWVEEKLEKLTIQKVVPNNLMIEEYTKEIFKNKLTKKLEVKLLSKIKFQCLVDDVLKKKVKPNITEKFIKEGFIKNPTRNWQKIIEDRVEAKLSRLKLDRFIKNFTRQKQLKSAGK